ncbi:MAG: HEAT repeat domain-containing protein [Planctomycetaceae bacterium]|nr:HEAT repeat domain-containing protein [Planctomycetaceae bacterium]
MFRIPSFFCIVSLFFVPAVLADNTQDISNPDLTKASWMWTNPNTLTVSGEPSYYRFKFRSEQPIKEATILITADNGYQLYINNRMIAEEASALESEWGSVERFRIENNLVPRAVNCIAIRAESLGGSACGLIVAIKIVFEDGEILEKYSGAGWTATEEPRDNWWEPDHNDSQWGTSYALVALGGGPWGNRLVISPTVTDPATLRVQRPTINWMRRPDTFSPPDPAFEWPAGIVYLQGRAPDNSTPLAETNFRIGTTRASWENDVPAPGLSGNKMFTLIPASPDATPKLILDSGKGWIGFPVSSFDGKMIYFSMAPEGETFYHLYSINADGTGLTQLTSGMWHDYDPCPMPDGSIVFASSRVGARDEYHANPSRSLFRLSPSDGSIRPITYHITGDTETRLMADGRLAFIRYDNFSERAKVESHVHSVRPDGTAGEILLGPDRGAIGYDLRTAAEHDAAWLRNYGFGAPSPLPDGRIAALSHAGPVITKLQDVSDSDPSDNQQDLSTPELRSAVEKPVPITIERMPSNISLIDISPLPDNRLLAATLRNSLAVLDPETGNSYRILQATEPVHSVNFLGERQRPRVWPNFVSEALFPTSHDTTGFLYCANVFNSKQTNAEWARVRAVRVYVGKPLTLRSARHQYGHIGTVGVDLGTFPIMPNGTFTVEVPADMPLAIQAVDAEGRAVVSELSWIYTRPGEFRACIGCHADRNSAPETIAITPGWRRGIDLTIGVESAPQFRANNGANGGVLNQQFERMRDTIAINLHPELDALDRVTIESDGPRLRPVVQHLVNEIQTAEKSGKRFSAIQRLGILRPCGVAPVLCEVMSSDANDEVRMIAALTLAGSATPESVPMLLEALADRFEQVGHAAHITLEHMTGHIETGEQTPVKDIPSRERKDYWENWFQSNSPAQIEAMNAAFLAGPFDWTSSADSIRFRQAVEALAHYGQSETVKASLRKILAEESAIDTLSKITVIRTLGILRDEQSIPVLTDILVDCSEKKTPPHRHSHEFGWTAMPDHIGGATAEALGRIGTQAAVDGLVRGFKTLQEFWFYTFRTADHDWLMGSVSAIIHYRILEAFEAIMTTTDIDVQKVIDELADPIIRSVPIDSDRGILLDNDDYERLVGRLFARSTLYDALLEACLDVLVGKPRESAIMQTVSFSPPAVSTGAMEPTSRAAMIIAVLVNDRTSAEHLQQIRDVFADFQKRDASRERSWTCYMLARALGRLKDRESIPIFLTCLTDEKREFDFGSAPPPNVFLHNAMTPVHRASVAAALGMIGDPVALPVLLAIMEDFHNAMDVRDAAAFAIQEIGRKITPEQGAAVPADFVQRLKTVAETYPEMYTGKTLSKAYEIWANVK